MIADVLLSQVDRVKKTGVDRWSARCPAHDDKGPSLSIREAEDGRVLVYCFAGCSVEEVLAAVGLTFDALFPPKPIEHAKRFRRPFNASDLIETVAFESKVIVLASRMIQDGVKLSLEDHDRAVLAAARIESARSLVHG